MALIYQIPIVGFSWIQECHTKKKLVPYLKYQFLRNKSLSKLTSHKNLLSKFIIYFPNITVFSNYKINRTRLSFDHLKIIIQKCGGKITAYPPNQIEKNHTLLRVKCDLKFDRDTVDGMVTQWANEMKAPNLISQFNESEQDFKIDGMKKNCEINEIQIDFRWITDCLYAM